jgi:hypothetical protein
LFLIMGNFAAYRWPMVVKEHRLFDLGGAVGIAGMLLILLWFTGQNIARLYGEERLG